MTDANTLKTKLQRELDALRAMREELDLRDTLARAEGRGSWARLEQQLLLAQEEIDRISEQSEHAFRDIELASRARLKQIKHGYDRIRRELKAQR
jgi:hypothetical protein